MGHRAAIIGLGQVGMMFDQDPKRQGVWTHFSAYERLADRFDLTAVCEVDEKKLAAAKVRRPDLRCYTDFGQMLAAEQLDLVSICTPPQWHAPQIQMCAGRVRAVICEKPLADDVIVSQAAVDACREAGTALAVNYYKRYDGCLVRAKEALTGGELGTVRYANALYSGPLDAVGSHALDALEYLVGPLELAQADETPPGRCAALFTFGREGRAGLHGTGPREDFVFELDILGSSGRIRILDNCLRMEKYGFKDSLQYGSYRELFLEPASWFPVADRFLPLFNEAADWLDGKGIELTSSGETALRVQQLMDQIRRRNA